MRLLTVFVLAATSWCFAQPNFTPPTPLYRAILKNDTATAKQLLEQGANPNEGKLAGFPPLFFAVSHHNLELFRAMVAKGADVNAKDASGSTILMFAAADEQARTDLVEEALKLGVDPNFKNRAGETALMWALRRGDTPVVRLLRKSATTNDEAVKSAVVNAIAVLEKSGPQFNKVSGCVSCHHQSLPQMAFAVARAHGFTNDEPIRQQQLATVVKQFTPMRELMEKGTERIPDPEISVSYSLLGLGAEKYPADATTAAMAHLISTLQRPDGHFTTLPVRPPLESSEITATALSMRALQLYGKPATGQIENAANWLRAARPRSNEDRAMQLLGLHFAKTPASGLKEFAQALLAEQRPEGGWAQLPGLESDAYATGQALVALHRSGVVPLSDPAFQRGIDFLVRTQMSDGSWLVRTRSFPVQPYNESGFPHGKNQWISASGTSWAIMALSLSVPAAKPEGTPSVDW